MRSVEFRIGREDVGHRLDALGTVIIGENRAAGDFGPAAFALQRRQALLAGQCIARALCAAQNIVSARIAFDQSKCFRPSAWLS